jgi:site-specific recombinase XerD
MLDLPAHLAKGRKARLIPLNTTAREMISLLVRFNQARGFSIAPEAPLLVNRYGKALSVRTFQHLVQRYREAAQLSSRITPHSFRHTLATELVRATGNVRVTQAILGHKRLSSTQIYVHPTWCGFCTPVYDTHRAADLKIREGLLGRYPVYDQYRSKKYAEC